eukprot:scaffold4097_cov166-Amphora_coffeaeformis.AAC.4
MIKTKSDYKISIAILDPECIYYLNLQESVVVSYDDPTGSHNSSTVTHLTVDYSSKNTLEISLYELWYNSDILNLKSVLAIPKYVQYHSTAE